VYQLEYPSMDTRDFRDPSGQVIPRVEAVRRVVDGFVQRRAGDRIGLIVFGDAPYPQVPSPSTTRRCGP
jgi:Ca-activated chloride channel family protein